MKLNINRRREWFEINGQLVFDFSEPSTTAEHFALLQEYYPLFRKFALGDTDDDREESFCLIRAHVARKMPKYRPRAGYGFASWIKTVVINWQISQLRKPPRRTSEFLDEMAPVDKSCDDAFAEVELLDVYESLHPFEQAIFDHWLGKSTASQLTETLIELGADRWSHKHLIAELREKLQDVLSAWRS